jgi:hypothetical protein
MAASASDCNCAYRIFRIRVESGGTDRTGLLPRLCPAAGKGLGGSRGRFGNSLARAKADARTGGCLARLPARGSRARELFGRAVNDVLQANPPRGKGSLPLSVPLSPLLPITLPRSPSSPLASAPQQTGPAAQAQARSVAPQSPPGPSRARQGPPGPADGPGEREAAGLGEGDDEPERGRCRPAAVTGDEAPAAFCRLGGGVDPSPRLPTQRQTGGAVLPPSRPVNPVAPSAL